MKKKKLKRLLAGICAITTTMSCMVSGAAASAQTVSSLSESEIMELIGEIQEEEAPEETSSESTLTETTMKSGAVMSTEGVQILKEGSTGVYNDYTYEILEDGTACITGYTGTSEYLYIPSKVNDIEVTAIAEYAFSDNFSILSVTIHDGVTAIGEGAFYHCGCLEKVSLPEGLTVLEESVFQGARLDEIRLPNSLTEIHDYALAENFFGEVVVPENVTMIAPEAFSRAADYSALYDLIIINPECDIQCNVPSYTTIYGYEGSTAQTFAETNSLEFVSIENYTTWEYEILEDGTACITGFDRIFEAVEVPEAIDGLTVTAIGASVFESADLTSVVLPDTITSIGEKAFYYTDITAIDLPSSVTVIGAGAFRSCWELESIVLPDGLTEIADYTFVGCSKLPEIKLPDGITKIGDYAFNSCDMLTEITIPETVTSIGAYAFGTTGIKFIDIPASVSYIGSGAFNSCEHMTDAYIRNPECVIDAVTAGEPYEMTTTTTTYITTMPYTYYGDASGVYGYSYYDTDENGGYGGFYDETYTFPPCITIHGYKGSTAEEYAETYSYWYYGDYAPDSYSPGTGYYNFEVIKDNEGGFIYEIQDNGTVWIYGYEGTETDVVIPAEINGASVTAIVDEAFLESDFTSVVISEGITSIGKNAFKKSTALTSITIPSTVTTIKDNAFNGCSSLTEAVLPDGLTAVGKSLFYGCSSLESVTLPSTIKEIPVTLFYGCTSLTDVTIPETVTVIGEEAFKGCAELKEIVIPESVTTLSEGIFDECTGLQKITVMNADCYIKCSFPKSITIYGYEYSEAQARACAYDCMFIDIGRDIISTGTLDVLNYTILADKTVEITNCLNIVSSIDIPSEIEGYPVTAIGYRAFASCEMEGEFPCSIIIPDTVTTIKEDAFRWAYLNSIVIPESVSRIEECAFVHNDSSRGAPSITILNPDCEINGSAFTTKLIIGYSGSTAETYAEENYDDFVSIDNTDDLFAYSELEDGTYEIIACIKNEETIIVPSEFKGKPVTSIGYAAFKDLKSLTTITIPDSVTTIGTYAFSNCDMLTEVKLPSGLNELPEGLFSGSNNITNVIIPDGIVTIGKNAFRGVGIKNISIPDTVETICESAFAYTALESISLPDSVTTLERTVFFACESLAEVKLSSNLTVIPYGLFSTISMSPDNPTYFPFTSIVIPESVTTIEDKAFFNVALESVTIPESVTSIGKNALPYAKEVTILNPDVTIGSYAFSSLNCKTIYGYTGSTAETYANNNGIEFVSLGEDPDITTTTTTETTTTTTETTTTTTETTTTSDTTKPTTTTTTTETTTISDTTTTSETTTTTTLSSAGPTTPSETTTSTTETTTATTTTESTTSTTTTTTQPTTTSTTTTTTQPTTTSTTTTTTVPTTTSSTNTTASTETTTSNTNTTTSTETTTSATETTPSTETTTGTTTPPATTTTVLKGDADNDGDVDLDDVAEVLEYYAGVGAGNDAAFGETAEEHEAIFKAVDIDEDGSITLTDASLILNYYAQTAAGLNPTWETLVDSLVPADTVDMTELDNALAEAQAISNDDDTYTSESYAMLQSAIENVNGAKDAEMLTPDYAEQMIGILDDAVDGLVRNSVETTTTTDTTTSTETTTTTTTTTTSTDTTTSTTETTTATTTTHIASDDELCDWAVKDYEGKTGVTPANAEIEYTEEGTAVITLTDAEGNVLDVYTIDPTTGTGTESDGDEVNLPQTGCVVTFDFIMLAAMAMVFFGILAMAKSRKRNEE